MGNAAADYYSSLRRPPENFYATSLVALDVTTGKPVWRFQAVKKDVWDYDFGAQATLVDFPTAGGAVPALILPSKQGDIYVLDRRTGKPLTPIGTIKAPLGVVEPQESARTQIVSQWDTVRKPGRQRGGGGEGMDGRVSFGASRDERKKRTTQVNDSKY